jgi:hypothetical protein
MSEFLPQYTFLPWLRRGIGALAEASSGSARLRVDLHVKISGDTGANQVVKRQAELLGPADVGGIERRAIVRSIPRAGVLDYEANFLAAIEFYDEDFPWRYTPVLPQAGQLQPWLCLVVLETKEFTRQGISGAQLPYISVQAQALLDAFPKPKNLASWAHVHLNFGLPPNLSKVAEVSTFIQQTLNENPNAGCSRLLCPRRLKPDTDYTAFLLPTFEKGRRAGLGSDDLELDQIPNAQSAWSPNPANKDALDFPVYFEWSFSTASAGDFEDLARKLKPADPSQLLGGGRLMDLQKMGWGQKYQSKTANRAQPGAIVLESALRIPKSPGVKDPQASLIFGQDAAADAALAANLSKLLNLGAEPLSKGMSNAPNPLFSGSTIDDDPFVVPPLYGSFYRKENEKKLADTNDWYKQLNTNPAYRTIAAQGSKVIQDDQEQFMDRAWDQLALLNETRATTRRWQFSLQISEALFEKRLKNVLSTSVQNEALRAQMINLVAPMHPALKTGTGNYSAALNGAAYGATYSRGFAKLTRSGGPLMRRTGVKMISDKLFWTGVVVLPPPTNYVKKALDEAINFLNNPRGWGFGLGTFSEENLKNKGLSSLNAMKTALASFQPFSQEIGIKTAPIPKNKEMFEGLAAQIRPVKTIPVRFRAISGLKKTGPTPESIEPLRESIEFPDPMYRPLAERDPHFILPALDRIPPNSVTLMEPNHAFIEAYLLGLNHEMAREFLWRELPVGLDGTFFQQFWDQRNNPNSSSNPGQFKDLLPAKNWTGGDLGAAQHRPSKLAGAGQSGVAVFVVKGDLLRKYPNTLIFVQKAKWKDPQTRKERLVDTPTKMPIFSAQVDPDFALIGFDLSPTELKGDLKKTEQAGWFFVLKERVGDTHFGLDLTASGNDPAWSQIPEIQENQCLDVESTNFKKLPHYTGPQAQQIASLLYQNPFMLMVHASQLIL